MTDLKYTEKTILDHLDDPIKSNKWQNLWFLTDGTVGVQPHVYETESQARAVGSYGIQRIVPELPLLPHNAAIFNRGEVMGHEVSHYVPMPVKS